MPTYASQKKNVNEHLRQTLTREIFLEVEETFGMVADANGIMPHSKLAMALQALGMSVDDTEGINIPPDGIDLDKFIELVVVCMKKPDWAKHEMVEAFRIFDKDDSGFIDPNELRRVFTRIGENLMETELEDQLREVDIDGDLRMALSEYYIMISSTKGTDFAFDDSIA